LNEKNPATLKKTEPDDEIRHRGPEIRWFPMHQAGCVRCRLRVCVLKSCKRRRDP
jgi:hypothetical protein